MLPWFQISHWPPQSHRPLQHTHAPQSLAWAPPRKCLTASGFSALGLHLYCYKILQAKKWEQKQRKELPENCSGASQRTLLRARASLKCSKRGCLRHHVLSVLCYRSKPLLCGTLTSHGAQQGSDQAAAMAPALSVNLPIMGMIPANPSD